MEDPVDPPHSSSLATFAATAAHPALAHVGVMAVAMPRCIQAASLGLDAPISGGPSAARQVSVGLERSGQHRPGHARHAPRWHQPIALPYC